MSSFEGILPVFIVFFILKADAASSSETLQSTKLHDVTFHKIMTRVYILFGFSPTELLVNTLGFLPTVFSANLFSFFQMC